MAGTPVLRKLTSPGVSVYRRQEGSVYMGPFPPSGTQQQNPPDAGVSEAAQVLE